MRPAFPYDSSRVSQPVTPVSDRVALGAVLAVGAARCMIAFASLPVFDMDPAQQPAVFVGATPAQSVLLDAVAFAAAAWLLVRCAMEHARLPRWWTWMASACLVPCAVAAAHAMQDVEQMWRCTTWIAAVASALGVCGFSIRDPSGMTRRALLAALAGIGVSLAVRGLVQMTVEHQATLAFYEQQRDVFLRAQGWLPGSAEVLTYERRLLQNEATGWFGFANVFATVAAASATLLASAALGGGRIVVRALLALSALLCAGLVVASGSKGGVGALAVGAVAMVLLRRSERWAHGLALLPIAALLALVVRGIIGEGWGEQSLWFRWHYLLGAVRTLADAPLFGVGPAGFQAAFMLVRPDGAVEEVTSAHGSFADWAAALGVTGLALGGTVLGLLWHGGARMRHAADATVGEARIVREIALASVVFGVILAALFEAPALDGYSWLWRAAGAAAGVAAAWAVAQQGGSGDERARNGLAVGGVAAACVVATHGQIDMVFWLPGSVLWAWLVLAAAPAPNFGDPRPSLRIAPIAWASIAGAAALALVVWIAPAIARQDDIAVAAAQRLFDEARPRSAERLAAARHDAARALAAASTQVPQRRSLALCAAEQWIAAARDAANPRTQEQFRASAQEGAALAADASWSRFAALRLASLAASDAFDAAPSDRAAAVRLEQSLRAVLVVNPRHCDSQLRLAVALAAQGRLDEARDALRAAALCNESFAADPLRQFRPGRMESIEAEIESRAAQVLEPSVP
ncbi:MAG: O-antigen ligase domain-containing protein [Planctomycetes bacterium]|nr:O-antigen ligase domain-containing protein [Planctomycetota bacterium]